MIDQIRSRSSRKAGNMEIPKFQLRWMYITSLNPYHMKVGPGHHKDYQDCHSWSRMSRGFLVHIVFQVIIGRGETSLEKAMELSNSSLSFPQVITPQAFSIFFRHPVTRARRNLEFGKMLHAAKQQIQQVTSGDWRTMVLR